MASQLCGLSLLQFTPSCAVWKQTQIFLNTTATCRGPSSTVSLWVETQTPLPPWQEPLQGLIMVRNRYPRAGSRAAKLFKRRRSWQIVCMNCTASGSEPRGELVCRRQSRWSPLLFWSESLGGDPCHLQTPASLHRRDICCEPRGLKRRDVPFQLGNGCMWRLGQWRASPLKYRSV